MAIPVLLQGDYSRGIVRDAPRHALLKGSAWSLVDYIPDWLGVPLQKRGGWQYYSNALGSGSSVVGVAFAPFAAGSQLVAKGSDGHVWELVAGGANTDRGTNGITTMAQRPVFFDNLLIFVDGAGAVAPTKYTGTANVTGLGGSPPTAKYATVYKSRLVLAGGSAEPQRLFFSAGDDPETWDTTNGWIDATYPLTGIAALQNSILIFNKDGVERITGTTPPPGSDMDLGPLFDEGCIDARSIATYQDKVIWANQDGVWYSDGAALDNLTKLGGILQYYLALMSGYTSSWHLAGGVFEGAYYLSVGDGSTFKDCLVCDLTSKVWYRHSNINVQMFAEVYGQAPEMIGAQVATAQVPHYSPILAPSSSNMADGDGTNVTPVLETAFFRGAPGQKRFRFAYMGADLIASAGTYLTLEYITSPDSTAYTLAMNPDGSQHHFLPGAASGQAFQRGKIPLGFAAQGIGLRVAQVGPSTSTALYDLEALVLPREPGRV